MSWNSEQGWIACGGESGLLKVLEIVLYRVRFLCVLFIYQGIYYHFFLMLCVFWGAISVVGWFLSLFILLVFFAYLYFLNLFHGCCFVLLCVLFFFVAIAIVFLNLVCVGLVICVLCTFCTDKQTKQQKQKEMNAHEHSRTKQ